MSPQQPNNTKMMQNVEEDVEKALLHVQVSFHLLQSRTWEQIGCSIAHECIFLSFLSEPTPCHSALIVENTRGM